MCNFFTVAIVYIAIGYFSLKLFFKIESSNFPAIREEKFNFSISSYKALFWPIFMPIAVFEYLISKYSDTIINHLKKDL